MMENESESESCVSLMPDKSDDVLDSLVHVPYSFQWPAQLLTLRCAQFQQNLSNYCQSLAATEENFKRTFHAQFQDQILVTGFTFDSLLKISESGSWKKDLVLALSDVSLTLLSADDSSVHQLSEKNSGKLILIDKLDLAELLNCSKTISSCKDVVKCNSSTRRFELAFPCPSFLTGVEHLLSLLINVISSLLQPPDPPVCVSYKDIQETLLEFPFWVHRNYAEAFLKLRTENVVVNDENKRVRVVRFERKSLPSVFLCFKDGSCISPSVLLHWYRQYLVKRIVGTVSSVSDYSCEELSSLLARILV